MSIYEKVEEDVASVFLRWANREAEYFERARSEYERVVNPLICYQTNPSLNEAMFSNLCFTEWFLFEFALRDGKSPLAWCVTDPLPDDPRERVRRLGQVADTQFFSRFGIRERDLTTGDVTLVDLRGGGAYEVRIPEVRRRRNWKSGTLALRIACVEDTWMHVSKSIAYDRAPVSLMGEEGPGEPNDDVVVAVTPEGWGFVHHERSESYYLNFLHDIIGVGGAYTDTFRLVA